MVDDRIGDQYLNQFDELDLSVKSQRRIAVYVLKEIYATVMADIGRTHLQMSEELKQFALDRQWNQINARLELIDGVDPPKGANKVIHSIKQFRVDTHHNTDFNPPERQLKEARELAPEWRSWLLENSRKYHEIREELDPRGTVIEIVKNTIDDILAGRDIDYAPLEDIIEEAEELQRQLEEIEQEDEADVTIDLVHLLSDVLILRQEINKLREIENEIVEEIDAAVEEAVSESQTDSD